LTWLNFSEEGFLYSFDTEGIFRSFNNMNRQWIPIFDFRNTHPETFQQLWMVNVIDSEIVFIELIKDF